MKEPTVSQLLKGDPKYARSWGVRARHWWFGPYGITRADVRRKPRTWQTIIEKSFHCLNREIVQTPIFYGVILLFGCGLLARLLGYPGHQNVLTEFYGLIMDIFVLLILFQFCMGRWERKQDIARHRETVEDYKQWDSEEARMRIAGAVRRLVKLNETAIDFSKARISDFKWSAHGINSLAGSNFFVGGLFHSSQDVGVQLNRVAFDDVNCDNVIFSKHHPFEGITSVSNNPYCEMVDCSFIDSSLKNAVFRGASLKWSEVPVEDEYEIYENEDGSTGSARVYCGSFFEADVAGAIFDRAEFVNADFRGVVGLTEARFFGAVGLENAVFDDDETKQKVLALVAGETSQ